MRKRKRAPQNGGSFQFGSRKRLQNGKAGDKQGEGNPFGILFAENSRKRKYPQGGGGKKRKTKGAVEPHAPARRQRRRVKRKTAQERRRKCAAAMSREFYLLIVWQKFLHKAQSKQKNKTFASTENQKTSGLRRKKNLSKTSVLRQKKTPCRNSARRLLKNSGFYLRSNARIFFAIALKICWLFIKLPSPYSILTSTSSFGSCLRETTI